MTTQKLHDRNKHRRNISLVLMRFANNIIVLATLAIVVAGGTTAAAVEANSGLRGRELGMADTAWYWGKMKAKDMWNSNNYLCTLNDVILDYWPDVMDIIDTDCVNKYPFSPTYQEACGDGAETYVWEKTNECVTLSECINIGTGIADGVIAKHCGEKGRTKLDLVPVWCEEFAKLACKYKVIMETYPSGCNKPTTIGEFMPLWEDCENEVSDYLDTAALPGTSGQPGGPGDVGKPITSITIDPIAACKTCKDACRTAFPGFSNIMERKGCKDKCRAEHGRGPCGKS
mmetsp:Transcript_5470/g.11912  ORF Transcript_5470/g.11912 Transcript_5470/m.11912 type:complete len:287 (-) Transcript_5470:173-1033(-)